MNNDNANETDEYIGSLIELLASDDLETCLHAARDLGKVGQAAIVPLIQALRRQETGFGAIESFAQIGEPAVAQLILLLKDPSIDAFVAEALRKIGVPAVPALIDALSDHDDSLRFWAAGVLGWIGDQRASDPLKAVLKDENSEVRESATRALHQMGTQT
jgi:HEAT repeat protein